MGAIIEQRDGYGWAATNATTGSDANGVFYKDFDAAGDYIIKTIYVDSQAGSPVFISKTFRVYSDDLSVQTVKVTTTGMLNINFTDADHNITAASVAITAQGYGDIVVEGYAITDVTVKLHTYTGAAGKGKLYPMYEAGY